MGQYDFTCEVTASIISSTDTTHTIKVECWWKNNGWRYSMSPVYAWVKCNGTEVQVRNGTAIDTTGISNQDRYSLGSSTFTINRNTTTWNCECSARLRSDSTYVSGSRSSGTINVSISPKTSYTVSYNANGGSGAPSNQTKIYGTNLSLSSTVPTRSGYNFKGWSVSQNGSVSYASGGTYSANAAVTLYAVWEVAYIKPTITDLQIFRCDSSGNNSETGTYIKVHFNWTTYNTVNKIQIQYKKQTATDWTNATASSTSSNTVNQVVGDGNITIDETWEARVYVQDANDDNHRTYSSIITLSTKVYPIDVKAQGKGIAFGKVAESNDLADFGWNARFRKNVDIDGYIEGHAKIMSTAGSNADQDNTGWYKVATQTMTGYDNLNVLYYVKNGYVQDAFGIIEFEMRSDTNNIKCWTLRWLVRSGFNQTDVRVVISGMTWTLYVYNSRNRYGRVYFAEISRANINGERYSGPDIIYFQNNGTKESSVPTASVVTKNPIGYGVILYSNASGNTGTVTLSETAANFEYFDIYIKDIGGNNPSFDHVRVSAPQNKDVSLYVASTISSTISRIRLYGRVVTISGTSITTKVESAAEAGDGGWTRICSKSRVSYS